MDFIPSVLEFLFFLMLLESFCNEVDNELEILIHIVGPVPWSVYKIKIEFQVSVVLAGCLYLYFFCPVPDDGMLTVFLLQKGIDKAAFP